MISPEFLDEPEWKASMRIENELEMLNTSLLNAIDFLRCMMRGNV